MIEDMAASELSIHIVANYRMQSFGRKARIEEYLP